MDYDKILDIAMNDAREMAKDIDRIARDNLKNIDSDGFRFLTNQHKGLPMPIEMARRFGFTQPVFKIMKMFKMQNQSEEEWLILSGNAEGIWVKEGLIIVDENDLSLVGASPTKIKRSVKCH